MVDGRTNYSKEISNLIRESYGGGSCESGIDFTIERGSPGRKLFGLFSYLAKVAVELFIDFMV